VDFYRSALSAKQTEISQAFRLAGCDLLSKDEIIQENRLQDREKTQLLKLLEEKESLEEQLLWAEAVNKTMSNQGHELPIHFLRDLPVNYLEVDPPPKPRLLYWVSKAGIKHTFLSKEIVAMLVGAGGVGKTHILAQLALSITSGIPFLGKFEVESPGSVCMILGENKMEDIHRLLRKTAKNLSSMLEKNARKPLHAQFALFDTNPLSQISERLCVLSVHGLNSHFLRDGKPTEFYYRFLQELKNKQPENGWSLILLDPISRFAGLDAEKDNAVATDFIALLERMSDELIGHPTLLISHHKPKPFVSSKDSDQTAARGASGLTDGVRWQANLDKQDDNNIIFRVVKSNFTSIPPDFKIEKDEDGSISCVEMIEEENMGRGRDIEKKQKNESQRIFDRSRS
jgi:hypothetical protein